MDFDLQPIGDNAVMVSFGNQMDMLIHEQVRKLSAHLSANTFDWLTAFVPAYTNITIFYEPLTIMKHVTNTSPYDEICQRISSIVQQLQMESAEASNIIEIPVCYGGKHGPDLSYVAEKNHLSEDEVIAIHSKAEYLVYMIGFAPGFPYIGGMSSAIGTPRKVTPRLKIPAGSVGIADKQTGIYPIASPGGWQIIGQTPKSLFIPDAAQPSLLKAGDKICFKPIDEETFLEWREMHDSH